MISKKYALVVLSVFLILLVFASSASAADVNGTDVLSADESTNIENNLLTIDNNIESNELDNNTLKAYNDDVLTAENNNWYVNGSKGPGGDGSEENPFNTLNAALNNGGLQDGDTIMIASEEYKGTDNTGLTISKNLNFIKYGDSEAIFNAEQLRRIWYVTATSINITGLTFKNGKSDFGGAITFENAISNSNINASFINNKAYLGGANYFNKAVSDSTVTGTYTKNTADYYGGANCFIESVSGSTITGTYTNNTAASSGGANYFSGYVSDSTVGGTYTNNNAYDGGANYFKSVSNSTVGGIYTNNKATDNGGGANCFYGDVSGSTVTGTYTNNNAYDGGANYFLGDSVSDSTVGGIYTNNKATNNGGANYFNMAVSDSTVTGTYTKNTADYYGGANCFNMAVSGSNITGTYTNNTAASNGGANGFLGDSVSDSTVGGIYTNNKATKWHGGANYFNKAVSDSTITGTYTNNNATNNGGANYFSDKVSGSTVTGTYTNNTAKRNGGANYFSEYVSNSTVGGTYTNNTADGQKTNDGGGANYFYQAVSDSTVTGTYTNNTAAKYGGANYFNKAVSGSTITGTYTNNNATTYYGGANYFGNAVSDSNIGGTYTNNTAKKSGGANYFYGSVSNSTVTGTYTNNNATTYYGGANYFKSSVSNSTNVDGTYTNNTAANYGGANYFDYSVSGSTVTGTYSNNSATNGGANYFFNTVSGSNVSGIYINNTASDGAIIYVNNCQDAQVNNAIFLNNSCLFEIDASTSGVVEYSWFGNNASNYKNTPNINKEKVKINNWLFLNATADPSEIGINESSKITFKLFSYDGSSISNYTGPIDIQLDLTQTLGELDNGAASLGEEVVYTAKQTGNGTVTGTFVNASYTIELNIKEPTEINITNETVALKVNEKVETGATLTPADAGNLTYTSSNSSVAIVENGKIKALAAGNAVITVSFAGDDKYAAADNKTIAVTVSLNDVRVTVNNDTLDLLVGENFTIEATTDPKDLKVTYVPDDSGVYEVNNNGLVKALKKGTGAVLVKVGGGSVYAENSTTVTVTVSEIPKENLTLTATAEPITVGDNATVKVMGLENASGEVTVIIDGNEWTGEISKGTAEVIIPGLKETVTAEVSYPGDEKYNDASTTVDIVVNPAPDPDKKNLTISASAEPITAGDNATVVVTGLENASGNVSVIANGKTYTAPIKDGGAIVTVPGLTENVTAVVNYAGDKTYNPASTSVNITVNPDSINIDAPDLTKYFNGTESFVVNVTDSRGNPLSNKAVFITINGRTYNRTTDDEGIASMAINLNSGNYNATVTVDDETVVSVITVLPTVTGSDITKVYGETAAYNATFLDSKGKYLNNTEVSFNINGKIQKETTDDKGLASLNIDLPVGNYTVTAENPVTNEKASNNIVVTQAESDIAVAAYNITVSDADAKIADIILPGDATGNVTVTVGTNSSVYDVQTYPNKTSRGGKLVMFILSNGLKAGEYNISAVYEGDTNYKASNASDQFVVSDKKYLNIEANAEPITVGENATVVVTGFPLTSYGAPSGTVTVTVGDKIFSGTLESYMIGGLAAEIIVPGLNETTIAEVNYLGDDKYNPANTTVEIVVNSPDKENLTISASAEPIFVGDNATVEVTGFPVTSYGIPSGIVTVTVGDKIFNGTVEPYLEGGNIARIIVPGLNESTIAEVNYLGDDKYNPANTTVEIIVYPNTINIDAPDVVKYYGGSERFVVNVTDSRGTPLSNINVTISINGRSYTRTTDENGTASLGLNLNSGTYNVTSSVDNQTVSSVVTVLSTVNGTDVVKMYRNDTQYYATFIDTEGKFLADGTVVKFNINGVVYERKVSGDKGLAKLNINLPAGEYVITAINPVTGENAANNITVLSTVVENRDITKYYKNATQYTVKVLGADGNPVGAGKIVTFNINGVMYQRQTNESGIAQLNINLPPGDYVITASYEGYNVANNITVLPVLSASDLRMKYMDGSKFKATLLDGQGKPYAEQKIQFNVNGVLYSRGTDSSGRAELNIRLPAGEYIITSSYNGANIANKITITP